MELLLPVLLLGLVFWMFSRQRKQQAQQAQLRSSLAPGQRIMTTAGLFGTVTAVEGDRMRVEISPDVEIEMVVAALAKVVPGEADSSAYAADEADDSDYQDSDYQDSDYRDSDYPDDQRDEIDVANAEADLRTTDSDERISLDKRVDEEPEQRPGTSY